MRNSIRRQLMFLRACVGLTALAMVVVATAAFRQASAARNLREITVERINVVDADGTLRLVISNKNRMHPGVMDGKVIDRPRPVAGLLFFNDEGDEVGGLTFTGREKDGGRTANAGLMFDQLKQDQTIGISYNESNGQRTAGFQVWDRSDERLSTLIEKLNTANRRSDPVQREAAVAAVRASAPPGPRRVYIGKTGDRAATVSLADAKGTPRLKLTVDAGGDARIEFLDEKGQVVQRMPERK